MSTEFRKYRSPLQDAVKCDSVLVKDTFFLNESLAYQLAWLKTVSSETYEEAKKQASFLWAGEGLFSGDYADFDAKRAVLFQKEQFSLSVEQARQVLIQRTSTEQVQAWRDCVLAQLQQPALVCWFDNVTPAGAVLHVCWKPGVGLGPIKNVKLNLPGTLHPNATLAGASGFEGEQTYLCERRSGSEKLDLIGTINGSAGLNGQGKFSASIMLPKVRYPNDVLTIGTSVGRKTQLSFSIPAHEVDVWCEATVSCTAQWETSGDPAFWFTMAVPDLALNYSSPQFPVFEGGGPRTEKHVERFKIPRHASPAVTGSTDNHHAFAIDLSVGVKVYIPHSESGRQSLPRTVQSEEEIERIVNSHGRAQGGIDSSGGL